MGITFLPNLIINVSNSIKHTKLNRCPKKIFTSDGEKLIKKKTKSIDHLTKVKQAAGENINGFASRLEVIISVASRLFIMILIF